MSAVHNISGEFALLMSLGVRAFFVIHVATVDIVTLLAFAIRVVRVTVTRVVTINKIINYIICRSSRKVLVLFDFKENENVSTIVGKCPQ
jgi:hypothetical protein